MVAKLLKITAVLASISVALWSCSNSSSTAESKEDTAPNVKEGERLAKSYCSSCHQFVDPSVLDKNTWAKGVLPAMGPRMGIFKHNNEQYPSDFGKPNTEGLYPSKPVLPIEDWQKILDYYVAMAPEKTAPQIREAMYTPDLGLFRKRNVNSNNVSPIISMVKVLEKGGLMMYDANSMGLAKLNAKGEAKVFAKIDNPVSYVLPYKKGYMVCNIGSLFPSDVWGGQINYIRESGNAFILDFTIRNNVERPVQIQLGDLNGDGEEDIVVCGFGHNKGEFYWLDGKTFKKNSIKGIPGAIRAQIVDIDKDGDQDIVTLFAQGTEKIILFENDGTGKFSEKVLKAYLPVQGSTYIEMVDMNGDGHLDILYTCGDNADYSVVFKNYHGVYIYLNDGKQQFKQSYFYPMNGAFKAVARDFDQDGDLDIAAISFFTDYVNQPYEGFLYFEQTAKMQFKAKTHPENYVGRWLTMDVGDVDQDGDEDIVLGNFSLGPTTAPKTITDVWQKGPAGIILENLLNP